MAMLKKITVDNYTTYINKTTFDFRAKNYKFLEKENVGRNKILKGALFIGENASGKTKILEAINLLLQMQLSNTELNYFEFKSFYTNRNDFSIEYEFDNDIKYNISFIGNDISSEELVISDKQILYRNKQTIKYLNKDNVLIEQPAIIGRTSLLRQYYFDTHFYGNTILNEWYDYIKRSVYINCYNHQITSSAEIFPNVAINQYLELNGPNVPNSFLRKIGYKQEIIYSKDTPTPSSGGARFSSMNKTISFKKDKTDVFIPIKYESTGNQTLIAILPTILHAVKNECMLIVDEFSSGLHNELEESLIKYFYCNSENSQLFFTTHSTNILDNTIIRPDQVYSIRFDGKNGSRYKRFSDEPLREAQNTEKMYRSGIFDDIPKYTKSF